MLGRTVKNISSHNSVLGGTDVEFTDGSIDYLSQWYHPKPNPGWIEELDSTGTRIGWKDGNGNWQQDHDYLNQTSITTITGTSGTITLPPGISSGSTIWISGAGGGGGAGTSGYGSAGGGHSGGFTWITPEPVMVKCSKCKEEVNENTTIAYTWNPKEEKCKRYICQKCNTKAMDKFYELDRSVETEEVLYGTEKQQK